MSVLLLTDASTPVVPWDPMSRPGLKTILDALQAEQHVPSWTMDDLRSWLKEDQEKAEATIDDHLRHVRFMEGYAPQPVMFHGTRYQFVLSGRLYYKVRKETGAGPGALFKDLKTLKTMGKFLGVARDVWPVQAPQPQRNKERIPTPEQVYELLHAQYTPNPKRSIVNAWVKYVLAFHYGFGLRSPKELWFLRVDDYDAEAGMLHVVEPKKLYKERNLFIEPTWLAHSRRHLSLDCWLKWRARLAPIGEAMFPNPITGKNFPTSMAFKQFLDRRVKPQFPWFHGYAARHWCVYARIIDAGFTDTAYHQIAEWFGHDRADMTRSVYGPSARAYAKSPAYGKNWMLRAFQLPPSRTSRKPEKEESARSPPVSESGSAQI